MASTSIKFTCGDYKKISYRDQNAYRALVADFGGDVSGGTIVANVPCVSHRAPAATIHAGLDICPRCETECFGDCTAAPKAR